MGGSAPLDAQLDAGLASLPSRAPIAVLLHGFRFSPRRDRKSPHRHILSLSPEAESWKAVSWPRALGFTGQSPAEGLCVAFGWEAGGSIWRAYDEAAQASAALARLVEEIRARAPNRTVDLVGHSLGARVALAAIADLPAGAVGHAVLMAPAEFAPRAHAVLDTPAGRRARILNVTSRENDPYDLALEMLVGPVRGGGRALGHGLEDAPTGWVDLQIDHAETLAALAQMGHAIAPPDRRICHWSPYIRPGMLELYRALIRGDLPFELLRAGLPQARSARWSRLLALPKRPLPLPFAGNAPS
ncbi:alpha/beta hydrolase [Rhodovulum sp. ES.010]|uniref:T6SS effector phospholipase Tle3 domain-containing protein n=1 Tax=Rhodovulum sp. ES.010 TaxID=1882821 RepID=UPI0020C9C16A|nr:alpha/beta hydrolase [Rhodovulum sp. ES.010]